MALFKTGQLRVESNNIVRTRSIFLETSYENQEYCILTLKEHDHVLPDGRTMLSLSRLYVDYCVEDPSEYTLAIEVFGSWEVWSKLCGADARIKACIDKAREEADVKRKSMAFSKVIKSVEAGEATFQAQKWLIDEPWKTKDGTKDGRKKRKEQTERAEVLFEKEGFSEDVKRLKDQGLIN